MPVPTIQYESSILSFSENRLFLFLEQKGAFYSTLYEMKTNFSVHSKFCNSKYYIVFFKKSIFFPFYAYAADNSQERITEVNLQLL